MLVLLRSHCVCQETVTHPSCSPVQNLLAGESYLPTNLQDFAPRAAIRALQIRHRRPAKTRESTKLLAVLATAPALLIFLTCMAFRASAQPFAHPGSAVSAPLLFEPYSALGSPIRYLARAARYTVFLSGDEADIVLQQEKAPSQKLQRGGLIVVEAYANLLRIRFVDSNPPTSIKPAGGENPSHPSLTAVAYRGIYPGTDVIVRGDQRGIEFQVNLGPGASAENIAIELSGATALNLQPDGSAVVHAGIASLLLQRPVIVFHDTQAKRSAAGAFRIESPTRLHFMLPAATSGTSHMVGD